MNNMFELLNDQMLSRFPEEVDNGGGDKPEEPPTGNEDNRK